MELGKGYKVTEVGTIPVDWQLKNIATTSTIKARIGWQGLTTSEYLSIGDYFLVTGTDFFDGKIKWETCYYVNKDRFIQDKNIQVKVGDILITKDGTIGKVAYVDVLPLDATLNSGVFVVRPKDNSYDPLYCFYIFNSEYFDEFLRKLVAGSTINHLYQKDFVLFNFPLPPTKAEQTAIASALSDADALISSLEKLIEKKRNIKQGAMQELLKPKKGWVVKRVEDIAQVGRGRVISHKEIALSLQNTFPVYSSQTTNNGIMGYIDTFDFDGEYVTWTTDGENAGTVFYRIGKFNCTNVCGTIRVKADNARFIAFLLNSVTSNYVSKNLANPKLMNDPMKKIEIAIPQKEEQDRIANVIMEMENEVILLEKKLSKSKMIKQGMMQELLTGKIRLV